MTRPITSAPTIRRPLALQQLQLPARLRPPARAVPAAEGLDWQLQRLDWRLQQKQFGKLPNGLPADLALLLLLLHVQLALPLVLLLALLHVLLLNATMMVLVHCVVRAQPRCPLCAAAL